ncbi:MAG: tyrosine-type recombinase/integrase [Bacillota bacterium]|nr:tyrosine-type recombinase/integrase [Bacillota bacterium]
MSNKIQIKGLRGTIYQRGEDSYRVQLSLGRNAAGKYEVKRETIRGREQDAIDLLTRWNVEYLDNTIHSTSHQTVKQAYEEWIEFIEEYRAPNTHRFYYVIFDIYILPEIGHRRLKEVTLAELQRLLAKHMSKDRHIKRSLSAFYGWCVKHKKIKENICIHLETKSKSREQTEEDVWNVDQVKIVYKSLTLENLYDIFIVLGLELGLRPQEIMALTWDDITEDYIAIKEAIKKRTPDDFVLGETKSGKERYLVLTPFLKLKLDLHYKKQLKRIESNTQYVTENNLVVADGNGHVPCLTYIRKYLANLAKRLQIPVIPPKNLRTTHLSLMSDFGIPLPQIQKQAGHSHNSPVTQKHYIRNYTESLRHSAMIFHNNLHGES